MSEFERLKEMVTKLRAKERGPGERRSLAGASAPARLASLVGEINETILPRRLVFQWDDGPGIQLAVANRRLQGVLSPSVDALLPHAGKPLSAPEDEITETIKTVLLAELDAAGPLKIKSTHLGSDDFGSDAGVSAEALARHWGLTTGPGAEVETGAALPAFLEGLGEIAVGWLSVEGEDVSGQGGSEADVGRLGETAAYLLDAYLNRKDALFGTDEVPRCYAVSGAEEGLFFGDTGAQTVFALSKPGDVMRIAALWQRSFG